MTLFSGAGAAPAGGTPAGYGVPAAGPGLALNAHPSTSLLDPALKDYTYDATGNRIQGTVAQQMVTIACLTALNSSAVKDYGLAPAPSVIGATYKTQRIDAYRRAFKPLADQGVAALLSVDVTISPTNPTHTTEVVKWQDLTTLLDRVTVFS